MDYRSFTRLRKRAWMSCKKIQEDIRQDFAYLFETCEEISVKAEAQTKTLEADSSQSKSFSTLF